MVNPPEPPGVGVWVGVSVGVDVGLGVSVGLGVTVNEGVKVGVSVGVSVGEGVRVGVNVEVSVGLGLGSGVAVSVIPVFGICGVVPVENGEGVNVRVGISVGGSGVGLLTELTIARPLAVATATAVVTKISLPVTTPNTDGNRDGKLSQINCTSPMVAVVVRTPSAILTNFLSPVIRSAVMPNNLRRFSRFKAMVFSLNALSAGMSTKT